MAKHISTKPYLDRPCFIICTLLFLAVCLTNYEIYDKELVGSFTERYYPSHKMQEPNMLTCHICLNFCIRDILLVAYSLGTE